MDGLLVRVGVDQAYGGWNSAVDPGSNRFVYVPIPENRSVQFCRGLGRPFTECLSWLKAFGGDCGEELALPAGLLDRHMHLDPDFDHLTYGDNGARRGAGILKLAEGDLIAFYAGLKPIRPCEHKLVYALVGLFVVDEVVLAGNIPRPRWHENAHTRKLKRGDNDVVIRAKVGSSGRLDRCIPIGEWRANAYRVRQDLLDAWGGLSVRNGYIQRSAVPPAFLDAEQFYRWFCRQKVFLFRRNN